MTRVRDFPAAHLVMPLVLSSLIAIALIAAAGFALPPVPEGEPAPFLQRLFANPFVVLIGLVGSWALVFGLVQVWAFQTSGRGVMARLAGHLGAAPGVVVAGDEALTVDLFAERWDHLSAIRMAPLSYAIWVLPLLGFIGTVIGISDAIGDLGAVFADTEREEALAEVLGALQYAFDTTFVGLVFVIPVMAVATMAGLTSDARRDEALAHNFTVEARTWM